MAGYRCTIAGRRTSEVAAFLTFIWREGMSFPGRQRTKGLILNKISLIGGRQPNPLIQLSLYGMPMQVDSTIWLYVQVRCKLA
jgi:hypothetical protein